MLSYEPGIMKFFGFSKALIAVVIQQSIYGKWNNAFYYFLVATLLAKFTKLISNISTAEG